MPRRTLAEAAARIDALADTVPGPTHAALIEELDALDLNDLQPISDLIGVIFEKESAWSSLRVGELKAMLALATGQLEQAAQWCHSLGFLAPPRQRLYRCIHDLITFELAGEDSAAYLASLTLFFGAPLLFRAQQIMAGELTFDGLTFASIWEEISPAHGKLVSIHKKLIPLKSSVSSCANTQPTITRPSGDSI